MNSDYDHNLLLLMVKIFISQDYTLWRKVGTCPLYYIPFEFHIYIIIKSTQVHECVYACVNEPNKIRVKSSNYQ